MDTTGQRALSRLVLALDALLVIAAVALAWFLHDVARQAIPFFREPPNFDHFAVLPFLAVPLFAAWTAGLRLHRLHAVAWTPRRLVLGLVQLHAAVFLSLSVLIFLTRSIINRSLIGLFLVCTFALLLAERLAILYWRRYQHTQGQGRERLLVVGGEAGTLRAFLEEQVRADALGPLVVGKLVPDGVAAPAGEDGVPQMGNLSALPEILHREAIDHVLFFAPCHQPERLGDAVRACEELGIPASFEIPLPRPALASPRVVARGRFPFVTFEVAPKPHVALALKHGADALVAGALLLVLAPLLLAIAAAIAVTMGRPVFFAQARAGLHGRHFRMLKFRTMVRDAERRRAELQARNEMSGPVFKVSDDPRITSLGRLLRRSSLDELPQLLNVLVGQMSLVGPRPLPLAEQTAIAGWQRRRLSMKPGITGLWQVSGRSSVSFEDWMRLDLAYVDRWSLGLDARILLRTVPAVLLGRGAR